jgi:hypothetical protein
MSVIDLDSSPKQPRKKKLGFALIASGCIAGVIALGSAFAGGITLNGDGRAEFGQGYVTTTTCDTGGIEVTPVYGYENSEGTGKFAFSTIQIEGVSANCAGKVLIIKVYNNSGQAIDIATVGSTTYKEVRVWFQPLSNVPFISDTDPFDPVTGTYIAEGGEYIVSRSGYWAGNFLSMFPPEAPIKIFTLSNLFPTPEADPIPDTLPNPAPAASSYFELDPDENGFEITFDLEGVVGFADARNVYNISIESVDRQS